MVGNLSDNNGGGAATGAVTSAGTLALLGRARVIPVIRRPDPGSAVKACAAMAALGRQAAMVSPDAAGWPEVIELTATTPDWPRVFAEVRRALADSAATSRADGHTEGAADGLGGGQAVIGLGTVTDGRTAEQAVRAGAGFLVSPFPAPEVRTVADAAGIPFIEGGYTPGELAASTRAGVAKLFPAAPAGPGYLRSVLEVLPGALVIPTGGIAVGRVGDWLAAGAYAVGVGGGLAGQPDAAQQLAAALAGRPAAPAAPAGQPGPAGRP
jgi:2-dehydro-3-deoxyphosphogluconate aldolase/(4S)-4-hydroxy-2-oxoglutarate aldolase